MNIQKPSATLRGIVFLSSALALLLFCGVPAHARTVAYVKMDLSVGVIDTSSNRLVAAVPMPCQVRGLAITPNQAFVYVATCGVQVIATVSNTVIASVPTPRPDNIAFTPDGAFAYVTHPLDAVVSVISTATHTVTATVQNVPGAEGIAITPNGALAYVMSG